MPVFGKPLPSQERLRELFCYYPDAGVLTWRPRPWASQENKRWNKRYANTVAGHKGCNKYRRVSIGKKFYKVHRLIWVYLYGDLPCDLQIDHRFLDTDDNRKASLRLATHSANACNVGKRRGQTSSRFKGVSWHKSTGKWAAQICVCSKPKHIGLFSKEIDAAVAYNSAAVELHGQFAHLNQVRD